MFPYEASQFSHELQVALAAVRSAARLARDIQKDSEKLSLIKGDRSPVSVADFVVQALVSRELGRIFPQDPLLAEEDSTLLRATEGVAVLATVERYLSREISKFTRVELFDWIDRGTGKSGERFWVLDPIDGTKGFLRGRQFVVALSLIVDGHLELGVLGCPNLREARYPDPHGPGSLVFAARGHGAWVMPLEGGGDFRQLRVSECRSFPEAQLLRSVEASHSDGDRIRRLCQTLHIAKAPLLMDSQAKYAVIASGAAEFLLRLRPRPLATQIRRSQIHYEAIWDHAAGSIIVEEAGGRVSDVNGEPLIFRGRNLSVSEGVLVSNGYLHDALCRGLARIP